MLRGGALLPRESEVHCFKSDRPGMAALTTGSFVNACSQPILPIAKSMANFPITPLSKASAARLNIASRCSSTSAAHNCGRIGDQRVTPDKSIFQ